MQSRTAESQQIAEQTAPVLSEAPRAYVIIGTTGEYSDRTEWQVAVVSSEDAAKRYIEALDQQYQQMPPHWQDRRWEYDDEIKAHMSLDPSFECDYTGTSYFYCECPSLSDARIADLLASAREVQSCPGVSETSSAAIKSNVFSAIDGKPIRFTDKLGLVHICEGADVHRGVRLIWTLCERDVPAGKAWKLDKPSMHEVCLICLKRSNERAALASAREVQP